MTEKEIAIGLYREGFRRGAIRRKLEITGAVLAEYLADEPAQLRNYMKGRKKADRKKSAARIRGEELLAQKIPAVDAHRILTSEGKQVSYSAVCRWHMAMFGRVNNRVPAIDYPVLHELVRANPGVRGAALSKLYHSTTGRRLDKRAAGHWCRKVAA